jgi:predicted nuclease of predicted toxin-antitoxin system
MFSAEHNVTCRIGRSSSWQGALHRVVITLDRDFAEYFVRSHRPQIGIVFLDLPNTHRTTPAINEVLARFFEQEAQRFDLRNGLTIVTEVGSRSEARGVDR